MNDLLCIAVKFYFRQHSRAFKVCGGLNVNPFGHRVHILQNDGNFLNNTESINFGKKPSYLEI